MNLKYLNDHQLLANTQELAKKERTINALLLWHIREVEDRKLYFKCHCNSIFEYLVKELKYAHGSAYRRKEAARLLKFVPDIADKIESGSLNLTTAAQTQSVLQIQEKLQGSPLSKDQKSQLIEKIEHKSSRAVDEVLAAELPLAAKQVELKKRESVKKLSDNKTQITLIVDTEVENLLNRAEELLSNSCQGKNAILKRVLSEFLQRNDPLLKKSKQSSATKVRSSEVTVPSTQTKGPSSLTRKAAATATRRKIISRPVRRLVLQRDQARCQHRDPKTGEICGSRHFINIDHVIPIAKGGTNETHNLRVLCRAHNILAAEKIFSKEHMSQFERYQR